MPKAHPKPLPLPTIGDLRPLDLVSFRVPGPDYTRHYLGHPEEYRHIIYLREPASGRRFIAARCNIVAVWRELDLVAAKAMPSSYYKNLDWPPFPWPYNVHGMERMTHPDVLTYQNGDAVEFRYRKHHHTARGYYFLDPEDGPMLLRRRANSPYVALADVDPLRVYRDGELVAQVRVARCQPFIVHDRKENTCH